MFLLRPRVWKINMQRSRTARWQQIRQQIRALDPHTAHVGESEATAFAIHFIDASHEAFHSDEVRLRIQSRVFDEERRVAAAEFDFHWLLRRKQFLYIHPFENGFKLIDQRRLALGGGIIHARSVARCRSFEQRRASRRAGLKLPEQILTATIRLVSVRP